MASELNLPIRLVLIVGGTGAYFGPRHPRQGGFAVFSPPALTALAIALFALSGAALFAGKNLSSGVREDRGNRWVIAALRIFFVYQTHAREGREGAGVISAWG
jgi:hypothetical protein